MNPSARGWIKKLIKRFEEDEFLLNLSEDTFYEALRACGFIYGFNMVSVGNIIPKQDLTDDELCKLNLFIALMHAHTSAGCQSPVIGSITHFYSEINEVKTSFLHNLFGGHNKHSLEYIINRRIQIDNNMLSKNFNYYSINALLYVDVLAYKQYLKNESLSRVYIKNLEAAIEVIILNALNSKANKKEYDTGFIKLFESSMRYHNHDDVDYDEGLKVVSNTDEKSYLLDLASMATWSDNLIDYSEQKFLLKLGKDLNLDEITTKASLKNVADFYEIHKNNMALLSSQNIVQNFYNNSSKIVIKLITRNSKRIYRELKGSKELMRLLTQSTVRPLTTAEQKKVNEQLLDIFKTIPSLAIFLLPGGALLLPLVIKFIPKLLPSAFDDNRIE
ncbi:LETM1-related biofilm-associated protein [Changchengzhania lutea]|uniref:LETM1-related biofilm-associated protein n=1 Tax=Changchengzhania lutea TaxID=2049305 RepID=UPI00115EEB08|nr:LETM1-related biofilm-associated protein [Changchengzhania lutea]